MNGIGLAKVLKYYNLIDNIESNTGKIICPFHDDINPSMTIDYDKGLYNCFACGKGGNEITFIKEIENINEFEAIKKYYQILDSKETQNINYNKNYVAKKKIDNAEALINAENKYYNLNDVDWNTITDNNMLDARNYMLNRGFTIDVLNKCGCKFNYNKNYPLIFPLLDNNTFMGWVCRTTDKETEKERKYLYNTGFSRRNTLCGNYKQDNILWLCEGYMDKLKLNSFGQKNVCALLGWKITDEQIQKLKDKNITKIVSILDNDECGRKGTDYLRQFFNVKRFKYLKGIKDPGDMSKELFLKMKNKTFNK